MQVRCKKEKHKCNVCMGVWVSETVSYSVIPYVTVACVCVSQHLQTSLYSTCDHVCIGVCM